jgi:hypothetical protein
MKKELHVKIDCSKFNEENKFKIKLKMENMFNKELNLYVRLDTILIKCMEV